LDAILSDLRSALHEHNKRLRKLVGAKLVSAAEKDHSKERRSA
jgi:hypothetical protein